MFTTTTPHPAHTHLGLNHVTAGDRARDFQKLRESTGDDVSGGRDRRQARAWQRLMCARTMAEEGACAGPVSLICCSCLFTACK